MRDKPWVEGLFPAGPIAARLFTPRKGERGPLARVIVERIADTGGGWYRPPFRTQDPAIDPQEPGGGESSSAGTDHGWANCTMSAGAMVLAFHTLGATDKWGGLLRHHQSDQSGGTDLYDLKEAWAAYGQELSIRSGAGWDDVEQDRRDGRAIVLQGEGGTPGAGTYTGGHAIAVLPETHSDGRWLIGNPECSGFEWVSASALRDWAENWSTSIAWARSAPHKSGSTEPPPPREEGMRVDIYQAFHANLTINDDGAQAVQLADSDMIGMPRGQVRTCFAKARLSEDWSTPGGTKFTKGTEGFIIGTEAAFVFGHNVDVDPIDDDIAEAIEARDAEWVKHLTPD